MPYRINALVALLLNKALPLQGGVTKEIRLKSKVNIQGKAKDNRRPRIVKCGLNAQMNV